MALILIIAVFGAAVLYIKTLDDEEGAEATMVPVPEIITNDPDTWPSGDRVWDVCRAIATAEGAYEENSNPDKLNNPGDISDGLTKFRSEFHSGSHITNFPDKQTGWQWLYSKIDNAASGKSHVYSADWTWTQFAKQYAADWQNWLNNVTSYLEVSPEDVWSDYINGGN
jgi:hypothetical protein